MHSSYYYLVPSIFYNDGKCDLNVFYLRFNVYVCSIIILEGRRDIRAEQTGKEKSSSSSNREGEKFELIKQGRREIPAHQTGKERRAGILKARENKSYKE